MTAKRNTSNSVTSTNVCPPVNSNPDHTYKHAHTYVYTKTLTHLLIYAYTLVSNFVIMFLRKI